ncbi:hypothetical protein AGABI2DRAFT_145913 [Agaricus bisporus var. bisporus H97]|uniref:hypothetical protein n=1 Tax=Agaricus bisporus var. bisporus (strain H97 / ATCC MYA-4626 / FGSC 10389) TaxID=936046 RepID=UPI00029F64B9|nr:hypothetical protein AGABI2DRAFT_145913 [Agaricus bisporus var. bisporus H97]EKV43691.1 hypothetical protein AGABI2DRAFT_145913 [Agaricus bisporus var. bisporus H97]
MSQLQDNQAGPSQTQAGVGDNALIQGSAPGVEAASSNNPEDGQPQQRQRSVQPPLVADHDRNFKSRTPELISLFKSLSLKTQLEWNKGREERNSRREKNRIDTLSDPFLADSDSENESIFSIATEDLDALCDPDIYNSYSDFLPQKLKLQLAIRKRKRGSLDTPKGGDPASPDSKRRRMNGNSLRNVGSQLTLLEFPDIMFDTENARVFLPLPLLHPECIQHVVANLNRVALTRVNPSPGELKGQLVLDIDKLSAQFGAEASPNFGYDRFLASSINYTRFQSMRDVEHDAVTGQGNGSWSKTWFDHFNFFSSQADAGTLYPYWRESERKLHLGILTTLSSYDFARYKRLFELARYQAENNPQPPSQQSSPSSSQRQFFRSDNRTPRVDRKAFPPSRGRKVICTSCTGSHSAADHITSKLPDSFPEGKPTFCQTSSGKLLHPDGREPSLPFSLILVFSLWLPDGLPSTPFYTLFPTSSPKLSTPTAATHSNIFLPSIPFLMHIPI